MAANTHALSLARASNQFAYCADNAALSITGAQSYEMIVQLTAAVSGVYGLFSKWDDGSNNRGVGAYLFTGNKVRFLTANAGGASAKTSEWSITADTLSVGTPHRISFVYDPAGPSVMLYIDGVSFGAAAVAPYSSIFDNSAPWTIGSFGSLANSEYINQCLGGTLDDFRAWNTARTAAQVRDNAWVELVGNESGLAGYWKLNNNLTDSTSNANNLTGNGSPTYSTDVAFLNSDATAIDFQGAFAIYQGSNVTSQNLAAAVAAGSNMGIWAYTYTNDGDKMTSLNWNTSEAFTLVNTQTVGSDTLKTWYLHNPTAGAFNVTAALSSGRVTIAAVVLKNTKQSGQPSANAKNSTSSATASLGATSTDDNSWGVMGVSCNGAGDPDYVTNTNWKPRTAISGRVFVGTSVPKTPAGTLTQSASLASSGTWGASQGVISPYVVPAKGSFFALM